MDKVMSGIISEIAEKYNISNDEVEKIFTLPYKMMREKIGELELHGKSSNDILDLKTNFNMPVLFKLYLNENKLNKINSINYDTKEEGID